MSLNIFVSKLYSSNKTQNLIFRIYPNVKKGKKKKNFFFHQFLLLLKTFAKLYLSEIKVISLYVDKICRQKAHNKPKQKHWFNL